MSAPGEPHESRRHCPVCGDVVGVYEPAVGITAAGTAHRSSLLVLAGGAPLTAVFHRDCFAADDD